MRLVIHGIQSDGRVREGAAGAHLGCHPDGFHDLLVSGTLADGELGVAGDAVWALGDVSCCDGDQLFGLLRQRSVGENDPAELLESLIDAGG
jgi:hypothetical protein